PAESPSSIAGRSLVALERQATVPYSVGAQLISHIDIALLVGPYGTLFPPLPQAAPE
ncbi:hypothetical protein L249_8453, partial [Ophiocordyceps polyrhachis-furcata BCC 54312]